MRASTTLSFLLFQFSEMPAGITPSYLIDIFILRCANIVPATQFDSDLANGNLPSYSYYTPNQMNDAHQYAIP